MKEANFLLSSVENRRAVVTIIAVQLVCAINWYDASSVFALIAADLRQNVSGLGVITATFVLGVGLFQLPAGLLAAKQGPKRTIAYGVFLISIFSILSGMVNQLPLLAVMRFVVGLGEAFIFGPGVMLILKYFEKGSEGLSLGLFGGAFDFGGILGISGWAVLGSALGWRVSLILGGILALIAGFLLLALVPNDERKGEFYVKFADLRKVLFNKWILLLSFGVLTIQVGFSLSGYFMVYYLESNLGVGAGLAGLIGGLSLAASVIASPLAGRIYDTISRPKRSFIALGLVSGAGLAVAWLRTSYAAALSAVVVGASTGGGFTIGYSIARRLNKAKPEYEAFGMSWLNSIGLFGSVWTPLVFSEIAVEFSYSFAWLVAGIFTALLVIPVIALKNDGEA